MVVGSSLRRRRAYQRLPRLAFRAARRIRVHWPNITALSAAQTPKMM